MRTMATPHINLLLARSRLPRRIALGVFCLMSLVSAPIYALEVETAKPSKVTANTPEITATAQSVSDTVSPTESQVANSTNSAIKPSDLATFSDQQIGGLLQRWPSLDAVQRRDLLAEVRKRMRNARQTSEPTTAGNRAPSLTVRIQRAKTRHGYGQQTPRADVAAASSSTQGQAEDSREALSLPRNLVIRTTVTRTLADGTTVTTEETLVPRIVAQRSIPDPAVNLTNGPSASGVQPDLPSASMENVRVVRAKVRFGAGFDQRRQSAGAEAPRSVRRVSTAESPSPSDRQSER